MHAYGAFPVCEPVLFDGVVYIDIRDRFRAIPVTAARVYVDLDEGELAPHLDAVVRDFPMVLQYNKRDLPGVIPVAELEDALNYRGVPAYPAATISGEGVFETLKGVSQLVLQSLSRRFRADAS